MSAVTVAVVGAREVAGALGKRGTQSDLTLYNALRNGHAATLVEPTQYPEKFPPLLSAIAMADRTVFVVPGLSREVGEIAATLDLVPTAVEFRLGSTVGEGELRKVLKGSRLESLPMPALQLPELREALDGWRAAERPGGVRVRIDHAFPVKGVGAVALGLVRQGTVKAHDSLQLFPTDRTVEVRSIQVHDEEVRSAEAGSRVGLALKGVEADDLSRGQVLAAPGELRVAGELRLRELRRSRYYRGTPAPGQVVHVQAGLQFVPGRWTTIEPAHAVLSLERPVGFESGEPVVVSDLSIPAGPRIVAVGTAE